MSGQASKENGKLGGRPKGSKAKSTLKAIVAREYIVREFEKELAPIVERAIALAKEGDKASRDWLSDQSWGKAKESMDITSGGDVIPIYNGVSRHDSNTKDIQPTKEN